MLNVSQGFWETETMFHIWTIHQGAPPVANISTIWSRWISTIVVSQYFHRTNQTMRTKILEHLHQREVWKQSNGNDKRLNSNPNHSTGACEQWSWEGWPTISVGRAAPPRLHGGLLLPPRWGRQGPLHLWERRQIHRVKLHSSKCWTEYWPVCI